MDRIDNFKIIYISSVGHQCGDRTICFAYQSNLCRSFIIYSPPVWPDWAIYWTLGYFSKPLATIYLPKSPTFLGNFCKDVKIYHFSSEIILGNFYCHLATFCWVHCSPHKVSLAEYWSRLYELYHHNCKRI